MNICAKRVKPFVPKAETFVTHLRAPNVQLATRVWAERPSSQEARGSRDEWIPFIAIAERKNANEIV